MHARLQSWLRRPKLVVALACVMMALTFGLSAQQTSIREAGHRLHGDVATSDGGWVVAACSDSHAVCDDGGTNSADGHHHHGADSSGAAATPVSAALSTPYRLAAVVPVLPPSDPLTDAEPSRLGHVPRASNRLT